MTDKDIVFITTTLHSKWLDYQKDIIKNLFPESKHLIVDGRQNWPYAWFYWMNEIKGTEYKWFIHIDEDCFLSGREEIIKLIEKMEREDISLSAVSDGYHHYRGANPVAINSFFMIGNVDHFNSLNFSLDAIEFWHQPEGWRNSMGILYDEDKHKNNFEYIHEIHGGENYEYEQEPYYMVLWMLKEAGRKFYYLYPSFDEHFKSTNPRIDKDSKDIAIHMWYTRNWSSHMNVHGLPNVERYKMVEDYLLETHKYLNKSNAFF